MLSYIRLYIETYRNLYIYNTCLFLLYYIFCILLWSLGCCNHMQTCYFRGVSYGVKERSVTSLRVNTVNTKFEPVSIHTNRRTSFLRPAGQSSWPWVPSKTPQTSCVWLGQVGSVSCSAPHWKMLTSQKHPARSCKLYWKFGFEMHGY